jgi:hypothetical protein
MYTQTRIVLCLSSVIVAMLVLLLTSCGAPGEPVPPRPAIPLPINDLAIRQEGTSVTLMFSLSSQRTTEGQPFPRTPDIEIYRDVEPATGPISEPTHLLYTIPGTLTDTYDRQNHFQFTDPLQVTDFGRYANSRLVYSVRASFSSRHLSEPSNVVALQVFPPARSPTALSVQITKSAIELSWLAPDETVTGIPIPIVGGYRVYRAEVPPAIVADALAHRENAKLIAPFSLLGVTPAAEYRDTTFQFGHAYLYSVRAVVQYSRLSVESDESKWTSAVPRDVFAPSSPEGLEAVGLPANAQLPARVESSWAINPESDIEGYNIYRKNPQSVAIQRLNAVLLPTPVFRDTSVEAGRTYVYQVTAVSKAGIESPLSSEASAAVPELDRNQ